MSGQRTTPVLILVVLISISACITEVRGEEDSELIQDKFHSVVEEWLNFFKVNLDWFSDTLLSFMKYVVKTLYFIVGLAGFVMWASGFSRYTGKKLVIGAIAMAFVSEILL